jgi:hypothetical protein
MKLESMMALLKGKRRPNMRPPVLPDPAIEFSHSENASLFTRLKEDAKFTAHSDLIPILFALVTVGGVRKGYAYGRPVMANPNGIVFAYAGGTHYIFFKLRKDKFDRARQDGGRFDPSYGTDWIEFSVGGRVGSSSDWQDAMRRWARISYDDSLSIE